MVSVSLIFALLIAFQVKHWLADYPFQSNDFMLGKFKPGWGFFFPLLAHTTVHGCFTVLIATQVIAFRGHGYGTWHGLIPVAWAIGGFDLVIHFVMDRIKASGKYLGRWKPITAPEYVEFRKSADLSDDQCLTGQFQEGFKKRAIARKAIRNNSLFWCSLGLDQMVHHLTHYGCIYFILRAAGAL